MNFALPICLALLFLCANISAQCPVALHCPTATDTVCDVTTNDSQFWNEAYWWDQIHARHDLAEAPADLQISGVDSCGSGAVSISCELRLDLDGDSVLETAVWSDSINPSNTLFYKNITMPPGVQSAFDERPVPAQDKYRFALETTSSGDTLTARLRWTTTASPDVYVDPQLPGGIHQIVWTIRSASGQSTVCARDFQVLDCLPPMPVCLNGLSVAIPLQRMITLWDTDLMLYGEDNITPSGQLSTGIRKTGTGTGFPFGPDGLPVHSVIFDCTELGIDSVELWTMDRAGNAAFCSTYVLVQDNTGYCVEPPVGSVKACTKQYCSEEALEDINFEVEVTGPGQPPQQFFDLSDKQGCAEFPPILFQASLHYKLHAFKDEFPYCTPTDIQRVIRHIDGTQPFTSPYQWVAADVNNDSVVDTADVAEMNMAVGGALLEWTNNTGWRFIDKNYIFPNPDPLADPIPTGIDFDPFLSNINFQLIGVRTGRIGQCESVGVHQAGQQWIAGNAHPNPTHSGVFIPVYAQKGGAVQLELCDLQGRVLYRESLLLPAGAGRMEIPESAFPEGGLYLWHLRAGTQLISGKIVRL